MIANYSGIQQCLQFMRAVSWLSGPLWRSSRKSSCFPLCHCIQLRVLGITGQSIWLFLGFCLHVYLWCPGLYSTASVFSPGRFFTFSFPRAFFLRHLLGTFILISSFFSGTPNPQFFPV